jgi:predicted component of type VI protein secretion system
LDARGCPNCRFAAQNVGLNEFHRRFMEGDPALERDVEAIIQRHNPRPTLI